MMKMMMTTMMPMMIVKIITIITCVAIQACLKYARSDSGISTPFKIKSLRMVAASFQYL